MKKYFQAPWNTKDIIITILMAAGLLGIAFFGMRYFGIEKMIEDSEYKSLYLLVLFVVQWVLIAIPLIILTLIKYKFNGKTFGLTRTGVWKTIKLVFSGYLLFLGITLAISLIIFYTGWKIPGYQVQERILPLFGDNLVSLMISGVLIIAIAPFIEEIFFRGFLLRSISNKWGIISGSIISAALFALLHLQLSSIIPIFILGLIINSLVIRSKSIIPAIAFHMFNNAIAFTIEILLLKEVIKIEELI